jgi:hypothetical protein
MAEGIAASIFFKVGNLGLSFGRGFSSAAVGVSFDGTNVHFTFNIPRGNDGMSGSDGPQGPQGNTGSDGSTGPQGSDGAQGPQGNDGPQGVPGEVTLTQLDSAISGTSANTNGVSTLDSAFTNDPPTLADMETLRQKLNEMILNGRR